MIEVHALSKSYETSGGGVAALNGIDLHIHAAEFVVIMGPSGSGKTTLMNILGCLDRPTSGSYRLSGQDVGSLSDTRLAKLRNRHIGFVFQGFNLLPRLTNIANIMLPMLYAGTSRKAAACRAAQLLEPLGLQSKANLYPTQISGGQQQRVAIARALANNPVLLLADEPTGNLDSRTGSEILRLFRQLNVERKVTIVLVTHDDAVARHAARLVRVVDGVMEYDGPVRDVA